MNTRSNAKDGEILNYSTENLNNNGNSKRRGPNGTDAGSDAKIIPRVMHRTTHRIAGRTIVELPRM